MGSGEREPVIVGFIFARGGSKGLPGKNIKNFHGKPLLAWTVECAKKTDLFSRIIVSTDDPAIAEVGRHYGAEVPFLRPAEFAADASPEWLAWRHAVNWLHDAGYPFDVFVSLPAVSPLRAPEDIAACVACYLENKQNTDIVITCAQTNHHPSFNMISFDPAGLAHLVLPIEGKPSRRQDVAPVYNIATVCYVASPDFILSRQGIFDGRVKAVQIPEERAVDIDTAFDFSLAEFLWAQKRAGHTFPGS